VRRQRTTGTVDPLVKAGGWTSPVDVPLLKATVAYVSLPDSYARTARSRNSVGYGLGLRAIDHGLTINSSELWG
jgi:hypothetical protein